MENYTLLTITLASYVAQCVIQHLKNTAILTNTRSENMDTPATLVRNIVRKFPLWRTIWWRISFEIAVSAIVRKLAIWLNTEELSTKAPRTSRALVEKLSMLLSIEELSTMAPSSSSAAQNAYLQSKLGAGGSTFFLSVTEKISLKCAHATSNRAGKKGKKTTKKEEKRF